MISPPSVLLVTDIDPFCVRINGFAPRLKAFIEALKEPVRLKVLLLDHVSEGPTCGASYCECDDTKWVIRSKVGTANPLLEDSIKGKARRAKAFLGRSPAAGHPLKLDAAAERLLLQRHDLVIFYLSSTSHLALRLSAGARTLCVIEEALERRQRDIRAQGVRGRAKRGLIAWGEARRWGRLYSLLAETGAHFVVISDFEREWLSSFVPRHIVTVVGHGIDLSYFAAHEGVIETRDIGVFGAFTEYRNADPVRRLVGAALAAGHRDWRWLLVGKGSENVAPGSANVQATGMVDDVRPYYAVCKTVVVPVFGGSGVKTTLLQAWAMGRPVVATSDALRGTRGMHGRNLLVGESEGAVIRRCDELLRSPALRTQLAAEGRRTVEATGDLRMSARSFVDVCLAELAR